MQVQTTGAAGRPPRESWAIGREEMAKPFDFQKDQPKTTEDLLKSNIPDDGVEAMYRFQRDCKSMKPATGSEYATRMGKGALIGAAVGAGCGLALNVMGGVFEAVTLGMLGHSESISLLIPAAMGAVIGTGISAANLHAERRDYPHYGEIIFGYVKPEYNAQGERKLIFSEGVNDYGQPTGKVNLGEFAQSPVIQGGEAGEHGNNWWQDGYPEVDY